MRRSARRTLTITGITALVAGSVLVAAPAYADVWDIENDGAVWDDVNDNARTIADGFTYFPDFLGSGVEVDGWKSDAFDLFLSHVVFTDGVEEANVSFTPASAVLQDGGRSTIVAEGSAILPTTQQVDVTLTLELEGSFARWTIESTSTGSGELRLRGGLGADGDVDFDIVSPSAIVSSDGTSEHDPIIGFQLTGGTFSVADGDDTVHLSVPVNGISTLVVALQDYDACGKAATGASMIARVPHLAEQFGATLGLLDSTCIDITPVEDFASSEETDQVLAVTQLPSESDPSLGVLDEWLEYSYFESGPLFVVAGLPDGLSLTFDAEASTLHLTGSTDPGHYEVRIGFAADSDPEESQAFDFPVLATLVFEVTGPELAETGTDTVRGAVAGVGFLALGLLALLALRSTRRAGSGR